MSKWFAIVFCSVFGHVPGGVNPDKLAPPSWKWCPRCKRVYERPNPYLADKPEE